VVYSVGYFAVLIVLKLGQDSAFAASAFPLARGGRPRYGRMLDKVDQPLLAFLPKD
jgi:hypothetical protein